MHNIRNYSNYQAVTTTTLLLHWICVQRRQNWWVYGGLFDFSLDTEVKEEDQLRNVVTVSVHEQIEKFEHRFHDLTYDAEVEIREKHTSVKKFRHTVILLPLSIKADHYHFLKENLLNINKAKSIKKIFMYLNLYWNFIDYHLLEHIIREHGSDYLKVQMEVYVQDLTLFKRITTIGQICGLARRWYTRPDLPQHFALLSTKFKKDPSEYTLEELEHFRVSFCREFSLSESAAMFAGAIEGSLIILWHIPSSLVPELFTAIFSHPQHSNGFFEQQSLLLLEIDGKCLYHSPASTSEFKEEVYKGLPHSKNNLTVHMQNPMRCHIWQVIVYIILPPISASCYSYSYIYIYIAV